MCSCSASSKEHILCFDQLYNVVLNPHNINRDILAVDSLSQTFFQSSKGYNYIYMVASYVHFYINLFKLYTDENYTQVCHKNYILTCSCMCGSVAVEGGGVAH